VFSEGGQLFWRPSKVEDTVKQQRAGWLVCQATKLYQVHSLLRAI
jgi:hypothetical protein